MAKFTVTFDRWTVDDIEHGESSENGFLFDEAVEISAEELELICWNAQPSAMPYNEPTSYVHMTVMNANDGSIESIEQGVIENHTYHPADDEAVAALYAAWVNANSHKLAA